MSESLDLDDVVRQFTESEQTLSNMRERLEQLGDARSQAAADAESLREASERVAAFVAAAVAATESLSGAEAEARQVLEAGRDMLDGSELREVRSGVDELKSLVASIAEALAGLNARIDGLEARVGDVEKAEAKAALAERQVAHLRANVGERHLKKALATLPQE